MESLRLIAAAGMALLASCGGGGGSSAPARPPEPYEGTFRGIVHSGYPAFAASEGDAFIQILTDPAGEPYVLAWSERGNWTMEGTFVEDWQFFQSGPAWLMHGTWTVTRPSPRNAEVEIVVAWNARDDYAWFDASTDYLLSAFRCGPMARED
jgi:hypothetical protein